MSTHPSIASPTSLLDSRPARAVVLVLVALGLLLRLYEYAPGRVFRSTEIALIANIEERTWRGLLEPMEFNQGAPLLFLWIQKVALNALGTGERAMRLWPLLAGSAALVLLAAWTWRRFDPLTTIGAAGVAAFAHQAIFFSTSAKQYSTDLLVTVLLLVGMDSLGRLSPRNARYWGVALAGMGLVWLSHPSVFIIAGLGLAGLWSAWRSNDRAQRAAVAGFCAVTAVSFGAEYVLMLRNLTANEHLQGYWDYAFMPLVPASLSEWIWLPDRFQALLRSYSRTPALAVAGILFMAGAVHLYRKDRPWFWRLLLPFAAVLAASALHKYPVTSRLLQFLIPLVALLAGFGVRAVADWGGSRGRPVLAASLAAILLIAPQALRAGLDAAEPERSSDIRPLLLHLRDGARAGDCALVHQKSGHQFRYYAPRLGIDTAMLCVMSAGDFDRGPGTLIDQRGRPERIWLIATDANPAMWDPYRKALGSLGYSETERIEKEDVALFLFDRGKT